MAPSEERKRAMAGVQAVFDRYHKLAQKWPKKGGEPDLYCFDPMNRVELLDAGPEGSVVYRFTVTRKYANLNNVMHGGAYGVLFDMFTVTALGPVARPGYWDFMGGVTRSLSVTYLKAVPVGTTVIFKSKVLSHGRTLATIRGEMRSEDDKILYAVCEHNKVNIPMKPEHAAEKIPWDEEMERLGYGKEMERLGYAVGNKGRAKL